MSAKISTTSIKDLSQNNLHILLVFFSDNLQAKIAYIAHYAHDFYLGFSKKNPTHSIQIISRQILNRDDVKTVSDHFKDLKNLARTNHLNLQTDDLVFGLIYGEEKEINPFVRELSEDYVVLIGKQFWYRLTGDMGFYQDLIDSIGEVAEEVDSRSVIEDTINSLAADIENSATDNVFQERSASMNQGDKKISEEVRKQLIAAQQGELDGVLMYQRLAELTDDPELKAAFKEAAADEGKHASILREYTRTDLKPSSAGADQMEAALKSMSMADLLDRISAGEYAGYDNYKPYSEDFLGVVEMMEDERKHGRVMQEQAARIRSAEKGS